MGAPGAFPDHRAARRQRERMQIAGALDRYPRLDAAVPDGIAGEQDVLAISAEPDADVPPSAGSIGARVRGEQRQFAAFRPGQLAQRRQRRAIEAGDAIRLGQREPLAVRAERYDAAVVAATRVGQVKKPGQQAACRGRVIAAEFRTAGGMRLACVLAPQEPAAIVHRPGADLEAMQHREAVEPVLVRPDGQLPLRGAVQDQRPAQPIGQLTTGRQGDVVALLRDRQETPAAAVRNVRPAERRQVLSMAFFL